METSRSAAFSFALAFLLAAPGCQKGYSHDPAQAVSSSFDGQRALAHVQKLVAFGPRPAGSAALEQSRQYLEKTLAEFGWTTQRQEFEEQTPIGKVKFVNLRARFGSVDWSKATPILVGSHYDTKLYDFPFVGANDGGSSTGALLEIARVVAERPALAAMLELTFFDGEEAFLNNITEVDGLYGSRFYARQIRKGPKPTFGVILDMIGDRELNVRVPAGSPKQPHAWLFESARELGARAAFGTAGHVILDDHYPLNEVGVPTLDVIDLEFRPWHTAGDTMDAISAESIQIVSRVTLHMIEKYLAPAAAQPGK